MRVVDGRFARVRSIGSRVPRGWEGGRRIERSAQVRCLALEDTVIR